ncbi:hypothetical protein VB738_16335 [Cyanobium gracile UHCC 0139]|uniref:Uncharacterized protein n=1 Tax=Cyanobium gracile UHCC 0139 TaxID=3110308 RepID=A0ABU5RYH8_9CYAN|nr:hypothetical protein [Cyanobium gracile]MEA5392831.1 hypothetical protein [Cyanobium gracile UHCC 0139]
MSRKSRHGNPANADDGFPPLCSTVFEAIQMAFVNEVVSDEDIARYNLPFKPGDGRYWTRDKELDSYLWGGIIQSYAFGYDPEGQFDFYLHGILLRVYLNLGDGSESFKDSPYRVVWKEISHIQPFDLCGLNKQIVFSVLKSALVAYGFDGRENTFAPNHVVSFDF